MFNNVYTSLYICSCVYICVYIYTSGLLAMVIQLYTHAQYTHACAHVLSKPKRYRYILLWFSTYHFGSTVVHTGTAVPSTPPNRKCWIYWNAQILRVALHSLHVYMCNMIYICIYMYVYVYTWIYIEYIHICTLRRLHWVYFSKGWIEWSDLSEYVEMICRNDQTLYTHSIESL